MIPTQETQLSYVERLLGGALGSDGNSEFSYITRAEGKPGFWELVAFRVPGLGRAAVGALHFLSQSEDPLAFARRSLAHYLTSPPQPIVTEGSAYPAEVLDLRRAGSSGRSTRSRRRANSATTPGAPIPGNTRATPTCGPA
jgi:hypothetical protein